MNVVTGATGLLGSHLVYQLLSEGKPVRALYRNEARKDQLQKIISFYDPEKATKLFEQIEWVKGDILDIPSLERIPLDSGRTRMR